MKVTLTIDLDINADTEEECQHILQEMDYNFSYSKLEPGIGNIYEEVEYINKSEIVDQFIQNY